MKLRFVFRFFGGLFLVLFTSPAGASDYQWSWGIQDRVMYSSSNVGNENHYDFFSQRLRLAITVQNSEKVGAFSQIEYRGTFGAVNGYKPSDAAFNRLNARGLRYGYIFAPLGEQTQLQVGLVPLNDQIGQTLFSSDWDFNVGGATVVHTQDLWNFRFAALRYLEGQNVTNLSPTSTVSDNDQNLVVLDLDHQLTDTLKVGVHVYLLNGKICGNNTTCSTDPITATNNDFVKQNQNWFALRADWKNEIVPVTLILADNRGEQNTFKNSGSMVLLEAQKKSEAWDFAVLAVTSAGKEGETTNPAQGLGYQTLGDLKGVAGYWGYTHIFTANGPSDVNGYLVNPGNKGFGLQSLQIKVNGSLSERIAGQVFAGVFNATVDMKTAANLNVGKNLGSEYGFKLDYAWNKELKFEGGWSQASLGNAGKAIYQKTNADRISQVFSRFQLEF